MKLATTLLMGLAICQAKFIDDLWNYGKFLGREHDIFGENVIMEPLPNKTGEPAALIFIIGAYCEQRAYMDHLKAIQEKVPYPLWVAIPHIIGDLPIPVKLGHYVNSAKKELEKKHGYKADKYFFGGHSLGASSIGSWGHSNAKQVEGMFLWGSYVAKSVQDPVKNYGAPVLTVGAEMDGWMARVTRIAEAYDQMKTSEVAYETAKYTHPVVLIPGMNHASFLSGIPPSAVQKTDLRASISIKQAIEEVSDATAAFLTITRLGKDSDEGKKAVAVIDKMIDEDTTPMLEPILEMFEVEGAPFMSSFKNMTPWVKFGQEVVAGKFMIEQNISVIDEYKDFVFISGDFSHAKPSIQKSEKDPESIEILSYSHQAYNIRTISYLDAADYYAATEVGAKFKSREAIAKYLGADFNKEDEATCKEINELAYKFVLKNFNGTKSKMDRFNKHGQPIEFLDDTQSKTGITWVNYPIVTKNTTDTFQVSSTALLSPIDFLVPKAAGMLYCKLMSPARILEWILVDGLKKNMYWAPFEEDAEDNTVILQ